MLMVKTELGPSFIHGIGLFAGQDIPVGQTVWRFSQGYDEVFLRETIAQSSTLRQDFMKRYAYVHGNVLILCVDDARFFNHSEDPNCSAGVISVALRDIALGEELTEDYRLFASEHMERIKSHPRAWTRPVT